MWLSCVPGVGGSHCGNSCVLDTLGQGHTLHLNTSKSNLFVMSSPFRKLNDEVQISRKGL